MHLSWTPPPDEDCNGDIIGYEVVEIGPHSSTQTHSVNASTSPNLVIPNLTFMGYKFQVYAKTSAGRGPDEEITVECKIANNIVYKNCCTCFLAISYFGIVVYNS